MCKKERVGEWGIIIYLCVGVWYNHFDKQEFAEVLYEKRN